MFRIKAYTAALLALLQDIFHERLVYLGLQGSYLRNEQTGDSDIDIMAVIDHMTARDLALYREALIQVGSFEKSCGFICGREELAHWNPLELCHLLHATRDLYGRLADYLPAYTQEDIRNYIKLSVGNLYHELCHRYVHADREKNVVRLPLTCKSLFFILQNLFFLEKGIFPGSKAELLNHLEGPDREVFAMSLDLRDSYDFDSAFHLLLTWCQDTLIKL